MDQNLLTVDELAAKLKLKKSWVYSRTKQTGPGAMPRLKCGKYLRFRLDEVMEWLEKQNNDGCNNEHFRNRSKG